MKKIAMLFIIAVLTVATAFSAQLQTSSKAKVSFTLTNADISAYRVGFTSQANIDSAASDWTIDVVNMDSIPASITDIELDFYKGKSIGSNGDVDKSENPTVQQYIFYKARGTASISLTLSGTPLSDTNTQGQKLANINYTVKVGDDTSSMVDTAQGTSWESGLINMGSGNIKSGVYPILIKTTSVTAANIGSYSAELTLKIASN